MYCVVTGACGFIGSNLVKALNAHGENEIIAVDDLTQGDKFKNLADCDIEDYLDRDDFLAQLTRGNFDGAISVILHQGACSNTMETDGRYMMQNNYRYSVALLEHCTNDEVRLIYASSAAVYGGGQRFREGRENELPLNIYGYSKLMFDQVVRRRMQDRTAQVAGMRYFNVYGPRESHKGNMASVAFHLFNQYQSRGKVSLFEKSGGYGDGEQRRDFIFVDDAVKVNLYFLDHPERSGIFNVGTGAAQTFNEVAVAVVNACRKAKGEPPLTLKSMQEGGVIEYIPFPQELNGKYQSYTQADLAGLRAAGYEDAFAGVAEGVANYVAQLLKG